MAIPEERWESLSSKRKIYGKSIFFKVIVQDESGEIINKFTWRNKEEFKKVIELIRLKYGLEYRY